MSWKFGVSKQGIEHARPKAGIRCWTFNVGLFISNCLVG